MESITGARKPALIGTVEPQLIVRLSALPTSVIKGLPGSQLVSCIAAIEQADLEIERQRLMVSDALYAAINQSETRTDRNLLLGARRDLFNSRPLSLQRTALLSALLSDNHREIVLRFSSLLVERAALAGQLLQIYQTTLVAERRAIQQATERASFLKGVLLSSPSLARNVKRYQQTEPTRLNSRDEQIERGLLRYLTRAAMKATPFSTFCTVIPGRLHVTSESDPEISLAGSIEHQRSYLRLNKSLYTVLWAALRMHATARESLEVALNPTLEATASQWVFLTSHGDREIFRRVTRNDATDLVQDIASSRRATFGELTKALATDSRVEATAEEAALYVNSLVEIGLLRYRSAVPEQEVNWDKSFQAVLDHCEGNDAALEMRSLLALLRRDVDLAETSDADQRATLFEGMRETVRSVAERLSLPPIPRADALVFEDATASAEARIGLPTECGHALQVLAEVVRLTMRVAFPRGAMATMRHFFTTSFGENDEVPLLKFYERFYREHMHDHSSKEEAARRGQAPKNYNVWNPFELPAVAEMQRAQGAFTEIFAAAWRRNPAAVEVNVDLRELRSVVEQVAPIRSCRSASVFAVFASGHSPGRLSRVVAPSCTYFAGYGKYFSRFLYLFPNEVMESVVACNNALTTDILAEIGGDAGFNANLHPPMVPFEIAYPTGDAPSVGSQLQCTDLYVTLDPLDETALALRHRPSGKRVYPLDLGFLSAMRRPPLYQLLIRFMPASSFSFALPEVPFDPASKNTNLREERPQDAAVSQTRKARVVYRPRLLIDNAVVVARRRWSVTPETFPSMLPGERDDAYFLRLTQWRRVNGVPTEVYVRIRPLPERQANTKNAGEGVLQTAVGQQEDAGEEAPHLMAEPEAHGAPDAVNLDEDEAVQKDSGTVIEKSAREPVANASRIAVPGTQKPRQREGASRDWWKPQYIHFGSTLLVKLFAKLPTGLKNYVLHMEERLPDDSALIAAEGERYTSEVILQLSYPTYDSQADTASPSAKITKANAAFV